MLHAQRRVSSRSPETRKENTHPRRNNNNKTTTGLCDSSAYNVHVCAVLWGGGKGGGGHHILGLGGNQEQLMVLQMSVCMNQQHISKGKPNCHNQDR